MYDTPTSSQSLIMVMKELCQALTYDILIPLCFYNMGADFPGQVFVCIFHHGKTTMAIQNAENGYFPGVYKMPVFGGGRIPPSAVSI